MKRLGNVFYDIISVENLKKAERKARKGKGDQYGVKLFDKDPEGNLQALHEMLACKMYKTSAYSTFKIFEPKEREVFRLPYYPDRIVHHAIMNVLEGMFVKCFTSNSYSCIKGKGIHAASYELRSAMNNADGTKFCLKLDIKKFYPNVDHDILKVLLRRKIKDPDLLWLLDEIIDSAPGLPIGNYLSQYLANFYLTYFDHWLKEQKGVRYYFRYADDIVILSDNKNYIHELLAEMKTYLWDNLKLTVKQNHQVFPVAARGIDFVGYVHFHYNEIYVRKSIKKAFARKIARGTATLEVIAAYMGWLKHANTINLRMTLLKKHETLLAA